MIAVEEEESCVWERNESIVPHVRKKNTCVWEEGKGELHFYLNTYSWKESRFYHRLERAIERRKFIHEVKGKRKCPGEKKKLFNY